MNIADAILAAPRAPACFPDKLQWSAYLLASQDGKQKPFIDGRFQKAFNFCGDCTLEYATRMDHDGKCNPSVFRSLPLKTGGRRERV